MLERRWRSDSGQPMDPIAKRVLLDALQGLSRSKQKSAPQSDCGALDEASIPPTEAGEFESYD
ncbi:MAG TPA: hypothetical protein VK961_09830 [Chthoniobacter sp.]|nr:hypothetical protein [Chthoniobacter sp.]